MPEATRTRRRSSARHHRTSAKSLIVRAALRSGTQSHDCRCTSPSWAGPNASRHPRRPVAAVYPGRL